MARKKQPELIRGHAAHRRTEGDYWRGIEWTADTTVQAWAAVARECVVSNAAGKAVEPACGLASPNL